MSDALEMFSLNTATLKSWSLTQCIEGCARHGIAGISPWRDRLKEMGVRKAAAQIRDAGLKVTGLCRGGMFPASDAGLRKASIDDNLRAIDEAAQIGAQALVMVCGGLPEGSKDLIGARMMVQEGLAAIIPRAREAGVVLALEPLHPMTCADRSVLSTIAQTLKLCDLFGSGIGIAIDVYHVWWDPDLYTQIGLAGDRIVAFHACDWLRNTKDLVFDRGMPGDGIIDIRSIREACQRAGYEGLTEIEILSERWWKEDPEYVLTLCKERHSLFC